MAKPVSLTDYMTAVKLERRQIDGCSTYSKWTALITAHFKSGSSVAQCAKRIVELAKGGER